MQDYVCRFEFLIRFHLLAAFELMDALDLDPYKEFSHILTQLAIQAPTDVLKLEIRELIQQTGITHLSRRQQELIQDTLIVLNRQITHQTRRATEEGYRIMHVSLIEPAGFAVNMIKHYRGCTPTLRSRDV